MRRRVSILCLCLAWLCANGAVWNVVQVVAWGKMFATNLTYLSTFKALEKTFDGSKPCELCHISQAAQDTAREQLPRDAALGGDVERLLLLSEAVPAIVVAAPALAWPGVGNDTGLTRTEAVPVPPPRA